MLSTGEYTTKRDRWVQKWEMSVSRATIRISYVCEEPDVGCQGITTVVKVLNWSWNQDGRPHPIVLQEEGLELVGQLVGQQWGECLLRWVWGWLCVLPLYRLVCHSRHLSRSIVVEAGAMVLLTAATTLDGSGVMWTSNNVNYPYLCGTGANDCHTYCVFNDHCIPWRRNSTLYYWCMSM